MPAAELQETGRIPPNAHHSMPEDGCRPCSGLDPPTIKKSGRAMPATPGKKDRLTCAWGLQPKGRKDATREGQDGGSRRRRDDLTTASDGTRPTRIAKNSMPEEARPRGSPKRKRQSANRMSHRRRARPRRSARATDQSTATIDLTGVGANASYPCGSFAAIDPRTGARRSSAETAESSRRFDHQARPPCGSILRVSRAKSVPAHLGRVPRVLQDAS